MKNQTFDRSTLLVWDDVGNPTQGDWITVLWSSFSEDDNPNVISLPKLVEEQAVTLRSQYLEWIYELGETLIKGKRIIDHLEMRLGLSFWWTFSGVGKDNTTKISKSYIAVRLMALESIVTTMQPRSIILFSSDQNIISIFKIWCRNANIEFELRRSKLLVSEEPLKKRIYHLLPNIFKSAIYLIRYLLKRWSFRQIGNYEHRTKKDGITFINYLDNLDCKAFLNGVFSSFYWANLPDKLADAGIPTNWLHHYVSDAVAKTTKHAKVYITKLNEDTASKLNHTILDSVLSISLVFASLKDYLRIVLKGWKLGKVRNHFIPKGSNIDLWPLFQDEWRNSVYGPSALSNCLFLNLFEKYFKSLPYQKACFYLQENQGWEMSLIHTWKASGHGHLVGVPHSTIRFWDLRYFNDPRSYVREGKNDMPIPDNVALNGLKAITSYKNSGYPENKIVEVEALRFLYLANYRIPVLQKNDKQHTLRILVLGDYQKNITCRQMEWLVEAAKSLPKDTKYIVKPHPNYSINKNDYPSLGMSLVTDPIAELLKNCDIAYTSFITSAAVDAYLSGITVVSILDAASFNMSPLRGLKGVEFVKTTKELELALIKANESNLQIEKSEYFTIDTELPRWKTLVNKMMYE